MVAETAGDIAAFAQHVFSIAVQNPAKLTEMIYANVDFRAQEFLWALFFIVFNPTYWNIMAQAEYRTKILSKNFGQKPGCILLGASIFLLGIYRDYLFHRAVASQPNFHLGSVALWQCLGAVLTVVGQIFNLTSFYRLGFYGTYLGDYFGIFVFDEPVKGFPYNVLDNPMYWGSFMSFFGLALYYRSPAGILLATIVAIMYKVAIAFEGRMLTLLYKERASSQKRNTTSKRKVQ